MAQSAVPQDTDLTYDVPCRRIQVSREKRPLNFFVTLSKKFLTTDDVVELSGLGLAVTTVVTIAEILKSSGFVSLEHIQTSLVEPHPDGPANAPKAKIQIWIRKTPEFDSLMTNTHNSPHHSRHPHAVAPAAAASQAMSSASSQLEAGNTNPAPGNSTRAGVSSTVPETGAVPDAVDNVALQSKS